MNLCKVCGLSIEGAQAKVGVHYACTLKYWQNEIKLLQEVPLARLNMIERLVEDWYALPDDKAAIYAPGFLIHIKDILAIK